MSVEIQKQIKDNVADIQDYRKDLIRWTDDVNKKEDRRERKKRGLPPATLDPSRANSVAAEKKPSDEEMLVKAAIDASNAAAGYQEKAPKGEESDAPIVRDGVPMHQYYTSWDQFDVDDELEKLDTEALGKQKAEADARQAEKDRILDELEWKGDGDRKRTTKAKPRVKISVRTSGRRASPVDLAVPKKEEANRYFAEGRFREAVATYTSALDLLEKYEPPEASESPEAAADGDGRDRTTAADGTGQDTEAFAIKTACLANRALALLKLEEWREAVVDCTEALRFDPQHGKATARRGLAYARMRLWAKASRDLTLAVKWDPSDKKASAELQMVARKLGEQNQEARAHAKAVMVDPTRNPVMPTRRLNVTVQTAATASRLAREQAEQRQPEAAARSAEAVPEGPAAAAEAGGEFKPAERKPYVPRSVRVRGLQPGAEQAAAQASHAAAAAVGGSAPSAAQPGQAASQAAGAAGGPVINYYTFEAQWTRHRGSPRERVALLRKVGSGHLPALLRESLDSDLIASIAQVFLSELRPAADDEGSATVGFAADVLLSLARTNRFDLSLRGLSQGERRQCEEVIAVIDDRGACSEAVLEELRQAYSPPPVGKPADDEESDPDDQPEAPSATMAAAVSAPPAAAASAVASASIEEVPPTAAADRPLEEAQPAEAEAAGAGGFSLDGCD